MIIINRHKKLYLIIILCSIIICSIIPLSYTQEDGEKNYEIKYKSTYFWTFINKTYYDSTNFELRLNVNLTFENSQENATLKMELFDTDKQKVNLSIERGFFYNLKQRMLYKDQIPIGRIHLMMDGGYEENETITLQRFKKDKVIGKVHNDDTYAKVMGKTIECYEVAVVEEKGNYTGYLFSKVNNILVSWRIDPGRFEDITYEDLVLKNLFDINGFFGHINLSYTNISLMKNQNNSLFDKIFPIILIAVISIAFLLTFILMRENLKKKDQRIQKR